MKIKILFTAVVIAAVSIFPLPVWAGEDNKYFLVNDLPVIESRDFPSNFGKLIVTPLEIDSKSLLIIKDALNSIGSRLKPLPFSVNKPYIILVPAIIQIADNPDTKIAGWFSPKDDMIAVSYYNIQKGGELGLKGNICHEFGHWVWCNALDEIQKQEYKNIVGKPTKQDQVAMKKYGYNVEKQIEEWFAEDFRIYAVGLPDVLESKLGTSHGDPEKLKQFFSVFANEMAKEQ